MFKVGVVNVNDTEGGRRPFVDNFYEALRREGYNVHLIDLDKISLKALNNFDILHFSAVFLGKHMWKVLLATHPKKLLTIHGWVKKESSYRFKHTRVQLGLGASCRMFFFDLFSLAFLKTAPIVFEAITCPTKHTAAENDLRKVTIISNAIFTERFCNIDEIDVRRGQDEILFVTYISIGGLKNVAVNKTIEVVRKINQVLKDRKVILLIFGNDYLGGDTSPYVRFMGFSDKFLGILKSSDLFITGKTFPDLGYAEMQAGALGIPIAKFTKNCKTEEIVDGQTGILAKSEDEMVGKILNYVSDLENAKQTLGNNFRKYIENEKSWSKVIGRWNELFEHVCQRTEKESGARITQEKAI
jgi:glycosyltransferase involved in cell wall biosynthesis